ncbi:MAG: phosphatase PAP2 family protein [Dongiaceae bacterium]
MGAEQGVSRHAVVGFRARRLVAALKRSFLHQSGLLAIIIGFIVIAIVIGAALRMPTHRSLWAYLPTYMVLMPFAVACLLLGHTLYIIVAIRPRRPLQLFAQHLRDRFFILDRLAIALPLLIFIPLFGGAFTLVKAAIPRINPFAWDPAFVELDALLHFGYQPWELLQPILGGSLATAIVGWLYSLWFFMLSLVWTWQAFSLRNPTLRLQFFYSLLLTWIVFGIVAAIYFASVGPAFYGLLNDGPDPFEPLLDALRATNEEHVLGALVAQGMLWDNYMLRDVRLGGGISAMPSMHVAMALLFALVGWRTARWLGIVFFTYFLIVLIGSVHLGWHYAIDGYAMVPGVLLVWWLSGWLARRSYPWKPGDVADTR